MVLHSVVNFPQPCCSLIHLITTNTINSSLDYNRDNRFRFLKYIEQTTFLIIDNKDDSNTIVER